MKKTVTINAFPYPPYPFLNNRYKFSPYLTGNNYTSATETNRLMLFRETVAAYCESHTEHTNTLCAHNAKADDMYSNYWTLKG
jgi:hypothetical protein